MGDLHDRALEDDPLGNRALEGGVLENCAPKGVESGSMWAAAPQK
jgi:hypothetical protein